MSSRAGAATAPVPVRDGATVMLVRDGSHSSDPLEVCMVKRHPRTAFGGYHAFPGGVVDEGDRDPGVAGRCRGRSDDDASALLGLPAGGLGFWVAAIRESFEEVGVLLACTDEGEPADPAHLSRLEWHRAGLTAGHVALERVLGDERLHLAVDDVHYFAHWITPVGAPSRYDTRFFVARAPDDQRLARHADELTGCDWIRPGEALHRHEAGAFDLIEPTIQTLRAIRRFARADDLVAAAKAAEEGPARPLPTVRDGGGRRIGLPGDVAPVVQPIEAGPHRGPR